MWRTLPRLSRTETQHAFSIITRGGLAKKSSFLNSLRLRFQHETDAKTTFPVRPEESGRENAAALFVSPEYARLLDDKDFTTKFVTILCGRCEKTRGSYLDVLMGVSDGLAPTRMPWSGKPRSGCSILYGYCVRLPGLWDEEATPAEKQAETAASVTFQSYRNEQITSRSLTLPMANTIFQNGRRSTLLASRFEVGDDDEWVQTRKKEKRHQTVRSLDGAQEFVASVPLWPLTHARLVSSSMGNIIRELKFGFTPGPASQELEHIVPLMLKNREENAKEQEDAPSPRPVDIWALVVPPQLLQAPPAYVSIAVAASRLLEGSEAQRTQKWQQVLNKFMTSGARLHKVLSGGGGWGAKKGLLSLDPETRYGATGQENLNAFAENFQRKGASDQGILQPGSLISFWAERVVTTPEDGMVDGSAGPWQENLLDQMEFVLGVASPQTDQTEPNREPNGEPNGEPNEKLTEEGYKDPPGEEAGAAHPRHDHFSVVSAGGIFVKRVPRDKDADHLPPKKVHWREDFETKVSVPGTMYGRTKEPKENKFVLKRRKAARKLSW